MKLYFYLALLAIGICLTVSACSPGELLGPTITPSPTNTPTATPTLTPTATLAPTITPTTQPTTEPTVEPTKEPVVPCETNLANWRVYPRVPNLIEKIKSGEVAKSLHDQHVFENLMREKGILDPFNPELIVKNIFTLAEEYNDRYYFLYGSKEAQKAVSNPESRNMWIVCGYKTQEKGYDMLAFAVAYPRFESPGSHVYSFIVVPDVDENGDPGLYTLYLNAYLSEIYTNGGQAMPILLKKDLRTFPNWDKFKNDYQWGWYPYLADAIGQKIGDEASIQTLVETGKAPDGMEKEVHIGRIDTWHKIKKWN